jgi:RsiW-degrading membrane proteinase PrsW (M82 family)
MPFPFWLVFLSAGVLSLLAALVVQAFIPQFGNTSRRTIFIDLLLRVALAEEAARLVVMFIIFSLIKALFRKFDIAKSFAAAAGLIAGLSFAAVEYAVYTIQNSPWLLLILLVRLCAVPLHAACGIRCGLAATNLFSKPVLAAGCFFSAVVIHVFFDFMLQSGGLYACLGILLALTALASQVRLIKN